MFPVPFDIQDYQRRSAHVKVRVEYGESRPKAAFNSLKMFGSLSYSCSSQYDI